MQTHFPSGDGSGNGAGLVLAPFHGVRYDLSRVGGLANVTSPPYDVIGPGTLEHLLAASPYNVVRLILPTYPFGGPGADADADAGDPAGGGDLDAGAAAGGRRVGGDPGSGNRSSGDPGSGDQGSGDPGSGDPGSGDPGGLDRVDGDLLAAARAAGEVAAARLGDWLAEGALAVDGAPALYVYEQRGAGWVQRGLIGLVAVGTGAVHPHEGVMAGPVAGRRELMKATRSNLEPILLVYNGGAEGGAELGGPGRPNDRGDASPGGTSQGSASQGSASQGSASQGSASQGSASQGSASRLVDRTADSQEPLACAVTDDGIRHRLWAVTDPAVQAAIAVDLGTRTALIADGHHRYAAYRELQAEMRGAGAGAGPWDYGLAFLVDADAYPLRLGPIHRVLPRLGPADAARRAAGAFTVTDLPGDLGTALDRLERAGSQGTAFLLAGGDGFRLLTDPDEGRLAAAMPRQTSPRWRALDASVMQELLLAQLWSIRDNVRDVLISHDAAEAARAAADTGGTAVICNPMPLAAVMDIAAHGEQVPRKSTSFGPKPRTGLVLRTFDS